MKVVHFTNNLGDGSGKAAYRLHKALQNEGMESLMLVFNKYSFDDDTVIEISDVNALKCVIRLNKDFLSRVVRFMFIFARNVYWKLKRFRWRPLVLFNFNVPFVSISKIQKYLQDVDIICLHSIQGFLSSTLIKDVYKVCNAPIVWTLMDISTLTGGCHFNNECDKFINNCGSCPQLRRRRNNDISRHIWNRKHKDFRNVPISLIAPTSKIYDQAKQSSLFRGNRIEQIFLSVNNTISHRVSQKTAREVLQLPMGKKIILFGTFALDNRRKGGEYLLEALKKISHEISDSIMLVTMARVKGQFDASNLPFEWIHLGEVTDDRLLSLVYQASDVVACPSIDDVGPMVINDAFVCGTPVVAFDSGVAPDLIKNEWAGYVAESCNVDDFRSGLVKCLYNNNKENENDRGILESRKICTPSFQAKRYRVLFEELLTTHKCV